MAHVARLHHIRNGSHGVLDRNSRIDPSRLVKVHIVGSQPAKRIGQKILDRRRTCVHAHKVSIRRSHGPEFHGEKKAVAPPARERLLEQHLVVPHAVKVASIEQCHASIQRGMHRRDALLLVRMPIHPRHAHAAQPHRRNQRSSRTKRSLFHANLHFSRGESSVFFVGSEQHIAAPVSRKCIVVLSAPQLGRENTFREARLFRSLGDKGASLWSHYTPPMQQSARPLSVSAASLHPRNRWQTNPPIPEELIIVLAIVGAGIWLLVKILQGIGAAFGTASKSYSHAAATRKQNRHAKKRDSLCKFVSTLIPDELNKFEKKFETTQIEVAQTKRCTNWVARPPAWTKEEFQRLAPPRQTSRHRQMYVDDIEAMLKPNSGSLTWVAKELEIASRQCRYPSRPPIANLDKLTEMPILIPDLKTAVFEIDAAHISEKEVARYFSDEQISVLRYNNRRADLIANAASLNSAIDEWNKQNRISWESYVAASKQMEEAELLAFQHTSDAYTKTCREERSHFKRLLEGYHKGEKQSVIERLDYILDKVELPDSIPRTWSIDFDEEQQIAVIEIGLPDVVHQPVLKTVPLKSGKVKKPLNQTERKEFVPKVHPAILLRPAYEVFRNDTDHKIALLVVNGWVKFDDPATGTNTTAYTASLMVGSDQIMALNLSRIDPLVAFDNLHGKSAGRLIEIIPIEPVLSRIARLSICERKGNLRWFGTRDKSRSNGLQGFRAFDTGVVRERLSSRGAEVKITQASRDRGVDAVVFDPDPIHGGKYVIQAKRYTNRWTSVP